MKETVYVGGGESMPADSLVISNSSAASGWFSALELYT